MNRLLAIAAYIAALIGIPCASHAAGTLPIVLTQQFNFSGCSSTSGVCGTPLNGGLLYFYQVGTVATPQNSFQDTGLTIQNPWPLVLDANGRVPAFYLADGSVHVRLTDSSGVVQFDVPSMLVIGPSGGGGGGSQVDPTTIASTGDIKFRPTGETITGWVKLNGQTIGSATSGASGRANADTQNLFVYEWTNCPDAHCPVLGGRGSSALADFNANKQLTLPDWRSRGPFGQDCMGTTCAGRLLASNVTSGGADGVDTPGAWGGESNHTIAQTEIPSYTLSTTVNDSRTWATDGASPVWIGTALAYAGGGNGGPAGSGSVSVTPTGSITASTSSGGSGAAANVMDPFVLGSWYLKL